MKLKLNIVNVILGILLAVGPYTLFAVCDTKEKVMRCMYSCRTVTLFGILIILFGILNIFTSLKNEKYSSVIVCVIYIFSLLVPKEIIGGCEMMDMRCQTVTFPVIYVVSLMGIVLNTILFFMKNAD